MLTIQFKTHSYSLPDRWEELTPKQYIYLVDLLTSFTRGDIAADMVRTLFFLEAAGMKPRRIRRHEQEQLFTENIYRISRNLNFMFQVVYENQTAIESMNDNIQGLLKRWLPEEIEGDMPEIRVARKLQKHIEIDGIFTRNLVPAIRMRRKEYAGYRFDRMGGVLTTDLPAGNFIDASTLHDQYLETGNEEYLNLMVQILYNLPEGVAGRVPAATRAAILYNFRAILLFIARQTQYGILWRSGVPKKVEKISIGFVDSLYTLSKAGYGDTGRLKAISMVEFLDLLLKEIIDTVKQLQAAEKNLVQISEITKLSIPQIQSIL